MSVKLGSTAIKSLYLGTNELKKIYLGSSLIYQKSGAYVDTEFSNCPFPISWIKSSNTEYYTNDNNGKWVITANYQQSSNHTLDKAFNNDSSTYFTFGVDLPRWIEIALPNKVLIKPSEIKIIRSYGEDTDVVQGYNPNTNEWEDIGTIVEATSNVTTTAISYSGNTYFSKFRLYSTKLYSSSGNGRYLRTYEFQVTSGTLRKES